MADASTNQPRGPPPDLYGKMSSAVKRGEQNELEELLGEWRTRIAAKDLPPNDLCYVLQDAVSTNKPDIAAYLLEQGSSFDETTVSLAFWLPNPSLELFQMFLDRGWDINKLSSNVDSTLLMCATDKPVLLEWCLAHGSDPNVKTESGWTALDLAASESTPEAIRMLVQHGADPSRSSAVHAAACKDPIEETNAEVRNEIIACLLHEYGMDIDSVSGWEDGAPRGGKNVSGTPLHRAIQVDNKSTVEFLLKNGADRRIGNVLGQSAIEYAEEYGSEEMKALLRWPF